MAERAGAVKSILIRPAVRVFDPILRCLMLMAAVAPLAVTLLSQNQQPRYLWPIWLVLPLAAAAGIAPAQDRPAPSTRFFGVPIFALAVVWSLPMFSKLDFQNVLDALMHFLRTDHRIRFNALPKFGMVKSPTYTRRSLIGTRRGLMPVKALSTGANFSDPPFLSLQTTQGGSPSS
jgi:hypothetical protein